MLMPMMTADGGWLLIRFIYVRLMPMGQPADSDADTASHLPLMAAVLSLNEILR